MKKMIDSLLEWFRNSWNSRRSTKKEEKRLKKVEQLEKDRSQHMYYSGLHNLEKLQVERRLEMLGYNFTKLPSIEELFGVKIDV